MELSHAVLLAVVEGITEFLPISSTGHLILVSNLFGIADNEFVKSFEIIIQLGAILAVVVLYWKIFFQAKTIWPKLFVGFLPTAIIGFTLYPFIKDYLLNSPSITLLSLFIGGIILIVIERNFKPTENIESLSQLSYRQVFLIGLFQSIAIIPGVSRAAATIIGGLLLGVKRTKAVEFSFLLAVPTMLAASGYDIIKSENNFTSNQFGILALGILIAFIVALISIKLLLRFIQTHTFTSFGIYRIVLAIAYFLLILRI